MTVKIEGDKFKIKNFLGEKIERTAMICPNTKVSIKGNIVEVSSVDIEKAGQTAANIEIATKIRNRDRRVFQDGIFITEKPGR
jgi:large subunit ribosomal protein L6